MFFYISKLLGFLMSPLTWVVLLMALAVWRLRKSNAWKLPAAALLILYLAANPFIIDECYRAWEPVTVDHDFLDTRYDGAIVLGGIGDIDLRLGKINFSTAADRLLQVLPYYHNGRIKKIIFTGGSGSIEFPKKREALYVRKYLLSIGFPDSAIIAEARSKNTYENAVNTKKLLDSLGLTDGNYLLVTSGYHMRRAMAVFKKAGFPKLTPYVTNRSSGLRRFTPDHLLVPQPGALIGLNVLLHEWVGYVVYKIKGYA